MENSAMLSAVACIHFELIKCNRHSQMRREWNENLEMRAQVVRTLCLRWMPSSGDEYQSEWIFETIQQRQKLKWIKSWMEKINLKTIHNHFNKVWMLLNLHCLLFEITYFVSSAFVLLLLLFQFSCTHYLQLNHIYVKIVCESTSHTIHVWSDKFQFN